MPTQTQPAPSIKSFPRIDRAVKEVSAHKEHWLRLPLAVKIEYVRGILEGSVRTAHGQVEAAANAKGVAFDSPLAGEDWIGGPYVTVRMLRHLAWTLEQLRKHGRVVIDPKNIRERHNGQVAVKVFPLSIFDSFFYRGFNGEVWMQPEVTRNNLSEHVGSLYRDGAPDEGKVALVLGAGNVASIAPLDVVHKLFFEAQVTVLKLNPVNDYLGPFIEDAFGELIRDGYLRVVYGGAEEGSFLCHHDLIDEVHITGSNRTHDLIVYGGGAEGAARKARNEPLLKKRITSELGNVSPLILVPGKWSRSDLRFQAENVATQMTQNNGFNCNAAKVLITHQDWPQRQAFLDELRNVLRHLPRRPAYYPGAEDRYEQFLSAHPGAEPMGSQEPGFVPPTLAVGVDPGNQEELAFTTESFCAFTAETSLPGVDAADFLANAVDFCNETLHGTLNAGLKVHPDTERQLGSRIEEASESLRYGTVSINHWPAIGFALGTTPWGAFPGHTLDDVQSGIGSVHNTFLFDRPQKSVIYGPFRVFPLPPWFVTHKNAHKVGERLTMFEANPGWAQIPGILAQAIQS
jgi:hypothetical protein